MATVLPRYILRDAAEKKKIKDALFEQKIKLVYEARAVVEARERELAEIFDPPRFDAAEEERYPPVWKPIKESPEFKGYDVDCAVPECMPKPFTAEDFLSVERENPQRYRRYKKIAQAAFTEINIHAEMNGESYAFNGLEKVASGSLSHGVLLMTFTVKQLSPTVVVVKTIQAMEFARGDRYLIGWRFKPEASAADCST